MDTLVLAAFSLADVGLSPRLVAPLAVAAGIVLLLLWVGKVPLSYNVRNLTIRWKTTVTTALAFTLVISLLTVMLAFVNGMQRLTEASGQPGNVMILSEGSTDEVFSNLGFSDVGDIENQPGILRENDRPLCSRETYIIVTQPIPNAPPGRPKRRFLQLRGIDDPIIAGRVHALDLYEGGTWFSEAGVREAEAHDDGTRGDSLIETVIGEGVARILAQDGNTSRAATNGAPRRLDAGDTFELGDRRWLVTGVMKSSGSTFDSEIWAKRSLVGPMFGKSSYTSLVARTAGPEEAQQLKEFFTTQYEKAALAALVETEYFKGLQATNQQFLVAITFVAVVMAVGGAFGVMNTMFAAVSQRRRDIGVLRLLGFKRWQILVSFLLESLVLAIAGGLLGCAVGTIADGWTATSIVGSGQGGGKSVVLQLTVDADILAVGVLFTLVMGIFGGLIPSLSAMRLRALDALR